MRAVRAMHNKSYRHERNEINLVYMRITIIIMIDDHFCVTPWRCLHRDIAHTVAPYAGVGDDFSSTSPAAAAERFTCIWLRAIALSD